MMMTGYLQLSGGFAPVEMQTFLRHGPSSFPVFSAKGQPFFQIKNTSYILRSPNHLFPRRNCIATIKDLPVSVTSIFSGKPIFLKLIPAMAVTIFTLWGLRPLLRWGINMVYHPQNNSDYFTGDAASDLLLSVFQPLLLWLGLAYVCRVLVPIVVQTESNQAVKVGLLNFVKSSSAVFAFAYFVSSVMKQAKRYFVPVNDPTDARNMAFQFAGKSVHIAVWVAVATILMEMLGFATHKWLTVGGLGLVLLALAPREIISRKQSR